MNVIYSHYENYAVSTGMQFEFGFGDYKDPFISFGIGGVYQKDMVFNSSENSNIYWLFSMGYRHDIHINIDLEMKVFNGSTENQSDRTYGKIDAAIGYKKVSNFFIRWNYEESENGLYYKDFEYCYTHIISLLHLQYYGDFYGLSVGYIYNSERYDKTIYESETTPLGEIKLDYRKSHGGGLTFYANNSDSSAELFGEFHLLADKGMNWMTISKIGFKIYF